MFSPVETSRACSASVELSAMRALPNWSKRPFDERGGGRQGRQVVDGAKESEEEEEATEQVKPVATRRAWVRHATTSETM